MSDSSITSSQSSTASTASSVSVLQMNNSRIPSVEHSSYWYTNQDLGLHIMIQYDKEEEEDDDSYIYNQRHISHYKSSRTTESISDRVILSALNSRLDKNYRPRRQIKVKRSKVLSPQTRTELIALVATLDSIFVSHVI